MKTDSPVKTQREDLLNRYSFAEYLIKGLLLNFENGQDSIVVGINGEWGSGKSSLLAFIKSEIENQTSNEPFRNYSFEFNPWRILNQDDLQKQFLKELGSMLGNYSIAHEQLKEDFKRFTKATDESNKVNPDPISKIAIGAVASIIKNFTRETSIVELKKEVDERLEDNNIKLFIILDDIDRLLPKEIVEIFQLIKLNANFKNTFFIVAFDKKVVIEALSNEFGLNGEKYIEKIIQIDYTLPSIPTEDISKLFASEIGKVIAKLRLDIDLDLLGSIWDKHLKYYFTTIRHINRFCNVLETRLPSIYNDVYFFDFILIETIRIFDFRSYEWVYRERENLTLSRISELLFLFEKGSLDSKVNEDLTKLVNSSKELEKASEKTKDLIIKLFSFNSYSGYEGLKEELNRDKRLASPDFFEQYFSFKVLSKNIPDSDYRNFIANDIEKRRKILAYYKEHILIYTFLKGLLYKIQKETDKQKFITYYAEFLDYTDQELLNYKTEHFEQNGWFVIVSFLIDLSHEYKEDDGFNLLFEELLKEETISYTRYLVLAFLRNRVIVQKNYQIVSTIPILTIEKYKDRILSRHLKILLHYADSIINNQHNFDEFAVTDLLRTLCLVDPKKYEEIIELFAKNDENAIILFKYSLTTLYQSNILAYMISNENHIMPTMTIEKFDKRISSIDQSSYSGKNKEFLNLFNILKTHSFQKDHFFTLDGKLVEQY